MAALRTVAVRSLVVLAASGALVGCGSAGMYDQEVCAGLGYQARKWVEFDLRQQHGLDQYEAVDAVDHAISEYCPDIDLR